jgi:dethiobiotin synthetase
VARGLFVTGTDTGVGKTVVSAALVALYRRRERVCYWKPVQTGIEQSDDTAEVGRLARCAEGELLADGARLPRPVSPHLAARLAGRSLTLAGIVEPIGRMAREAGAPAPFWIVEGAGGVLVPIDDHATMADVMSMLGLPVVIVARTAVGTINHTLLTIEALRRRDLAIAGVVMSGAPDAGAREAIEHHGRVSVLAEVPLLEPLDSDAIDRWAADVSASWPI